MTVEINIPGGEMQIDVDRFFAQADIGKIRKMFKCLRASGIDGLTRHGLDTFLQDKMREAETDKNYYAQKYADELDRASGLEEEYRRMKSSCYPEFTRDKGKLAEKKKEVTASGRMASAYKKRSRDAVQMEKRYQKIQGFWTEIC